MSDSKYILAGMRQGFDYTGCTRIDLPPNAGGHHYSEFRHKDGTLQAVVKAGLLTRPGLNEPEAGAKSLEAPKK